MSGYFILNSIRPSFLALERYLDTATLDEVLAYMDESGGEPVDAAIWFLKNKEDKWTDFVPSDIADKIKAAVAQM